MEKESESENEDKEVKEDEEQGEKGIEQAVEKEKEKKKEVKNKEGEEADQKVNESDSAELGGDEDLSETKSDASPTLIRKSGHEYTLRQIKCIKFSNTSKTTLELTPSRSPTPSPSTPIHVFSPQATPPHPTTPPSSPK